MKKMRLWTMRLEHFGLSLLLILGMARAFAEPGLSLPHEYSDGVPAAVSATTAPEAEILPSQFVPVRDQPFALPEAGAQAMGNSNEQTSLVSNSRRQGRLTPEARRALRQQINEARHDIYAPRP